MSDHDKFMIACLCGTELPVEWDIRQRRWKGECPRCHRHWRNKKREVAEGVPRQLNSNYQWANKPEATVCLTRDGLKACFRNLEKQDTYPVSDAMQEAIEALKRHLEELFFEEKSNEPSA